MNKLFNKISSKFSVTTIIYLGLGSMIISIVAIISVFLYASSTIEQSESTMNSILELEKQNKSILHNIQRVSDIEMSLLLAKNKEELDSLDEKMSENITAISKINLQTSEKNIEKYNKALNEITVALDIHLQMQVDMYELVYSLRHYEDENFNDLLKIEREILFIRNYIDDVSGKIKLQNKRNNRKLTHELKNAVYDENEMTPKIIKVLVGSQERVSTDINDLQKSILSLTAIAREISLAPNRDVINDLKTNKVLQSRNFLEKKISKLRESLKSNEYLSKTISKIVNPLIKINELEDSLIVLKEFTFLQREKLNQLIVDRNKINLTIVNNLEILSNIAKQINTDVIQSFHITSKNTIYMIIIIVLCVTFFLITFGLTLLSRVNKPLRHITQSIQNISQEHNNLHENISVEFDDEYKKLVDAFNKMTSSLSKNIEKLNIRDKEISMMNQELETRVKKRTHQLSVKTQEISNLLDNAGEGFLSFNKDFVILDEYSKECENLIGKDFKSQSIIDVLYKNYEEKKDFYQQTLLDALSFKETIIRNSFLKLLPKEIEFNKKILQIEYKILQNDNYMLILNDISDKKALELKIVQEQEILKMIVSIVSDSTLFFETRDDFIAFSKDMSMLSNSHTTSLKTLSEVYRAVHTFKGIFSQFFMHNIVTSLHEMETQISHFLKVQEASCRLSEIINKSILIENFDKDLEIIKNILGEKYFDETMMLKINEESIIKLENKISSYCNFDKVHSLNYEDILKDTHKLRDKPFLDLLSGYPKMCMDLAKKLNKQIYPFEVIGDKKITVSEEYKPFSKSLIHVFRNMIDHGIEDIDTRVCNNKDEKGTIVCSFTLVDNYLNIMVCDDGGGIDLEAIKNKAVQNNLFTEKEIRAMSNKDIFELIFHESFSTKEEVSETSGRGIGLYAVKSELDKIQGTLEISTVFGNGTTFIFKLPWYY